MAFTRKNVKFEWTNAYEKSFQELKKQFETIPILTILEGEDGFVVYCEALGQGLGATLMWYGSDCLCFSSVVRFRKELPDT